MRSDLFASGLVGPSGHVFTLQNPKACRVSLAGEVLAKGGSMVAYDGFVTFAWERPNMLPALLSQYPKEGMLLMRCSGQGELFLADAARDVHLVYLEGERLTVSVASLLAFEAGSMTWTIARLEPPPGLPTKGLWNVVLSGTGWVALTSVGPPIVMPVTSQSRVFVDPDAIIAWSTDLHLTYEQSVVLTTVWAPEAGGGEELQLRAEGPQGYVFVQPSERPGGRRKKR